MIEALAIVSQGIEEVFVDVLQWFDVNYVTFLVDLVVHLTNVGVVCLALLFMVPEPLAWFGLRHRLKKWYDLFQRLPDSVRCPWKAA